MLQPSTSKLRMTTKSSKSGQLKLPDLLPLNKKRQPSSSTLDAENNNNVEASNFKLISNQMISIMSSEEHSSKKKMCGKKQVSQKDVNENLTDVNLPQTEAGSSHIDPVVSRKRKALDQLNAVQSYIEDTKKKMNQENKVENLEKNEKLFVRLVKLDISDKVDAKIDLTLAAESPLSRLSLVRQPTKKVSKSELQKQNFININKTESAKMEEMLLKSFKKRQERQMLEGNTRITSETSESEIEPYVYEKTKKSVYETYQVIEGACDQRILRCLLCPFNAATFKQMSLHYKFKHRDTPLEEMHFCNIKGCKFKTVHRGMLKWHMNRHSLAADKLETEHYPCTQCDKVFVQRKGFLIHLKHMHKDPSASDSEVADYPCATCNYRTSSQQNLRAHIYRSHIPEEAKRKFKCNICGFETNYKDSLKKHLGRVHLKKDKKD